MIDNTYLDKTGLEYFWGKVKTYIQEKGNSASADKLSNKVTIGLTGGVTSNTISFDGSEKTQQNISVNSISEAYLKWGGKNFSGAFGPIDGAMVSDLGANRFAFLKKDGVTIEYSRDGGSSWADYGDEDAKITLFGTGAAIKVGKPDSSTEVTSKYQVRITVDTIKCEVYSTLHKFVILLSTNGSSGCTCTIEKALGNKPDEFTIAANNIGVGGWAGYNVINVDNITTAIDSNKNDGDKFSKIRFTFKIESNDGKYDGLTVNQIMAFGGVGWGTPSNLAKTGHVYSYDSWQNVTFPAKVTASSYGGLPVSSTSVQGIVQLSSSVEDNETKAATPKAVKTAQDTAQESLNSHKNQISTNSTIGHLKSAKYHSANATGITESSDETAVVVNAVTNTAGKYYAVETDAKGFGFVNVPWTNTTYSEFKGATDGTDGASGLVKKPMIADKSKFLKGDGTWASTPYPSTVGVKDSTGLVKNGSDVTNASGHAPTPIIGGIPYYKVYSLGSFRVNASAAELNYCKGVTSAIQDQLNSKSANGHTHVIDNITDLDNGWDTLLKAAPTNYVTRWPSVGEVTDRKNLTIKINSGAEEGVNLYTYNLSGEKTLDLKSGSGIVVSGASGVATFSHSGADGFKHIPSGGNAGQLLKNSAAGTAIWVNASSDLITSMAGYSVQSAAAIGVSDSLNIAIGKLEGRVNKIDAEVSRVDGTVLVLAH